MALGTNHVTLPLVSAASRTRSNSAFIRELWNDEIIATYKSNYVMVPLVVTMNHNKKKGDTVHVPRPVRGDASVKAAETQVTLIANQENQNQYIIDQHWEYSRLIEDIVSIQADDSIRPFYTDDAGYALARRVDNFIHAQGAKLSGASATPLVESANYSNAVTGDGTTAWDGSANANAGNASTLTDEGMRLLVQQLDNLDVPSMGRVFTTTPVEKRKMLGIDRHVVFDKIGEAGSANAMRTGYIAPLYGVDFYLSTNCATVLGDDASTVNKAGLFFQKDALLLIEQMNPRSQTQYKQEYLSDLFTADILFGGGVLRPEGGIPVIVPNA